MEPSLELNQLIALFLAEVIRTRRTSLRRAAEISHLVVSRLPQINSEDQMLLMLTDIEKEFEEVSALKQVLHFGYGPSDIKVYEREIKEYASKIFIKDIHTSNTFLQDAAQPGMNIQQLCLKYPDFCQYLLSFPEKAQALAELQP